MKVVTLGEIMLRLKSPSYQRFVQSQSFEATYGGGEANVSVSLANYGYDSNFVSKVPDNEIGKSSLMSLKALGVKTCNVAQGGDRLGIYFLEGGTSVRPSKVIYDRANSSISQAKVSDFDLDKIFENVDWFHTTGITPALSSNGKDLTEAFLKKAKEKNVTVSVDLNYRKKLWTKEEAQKTMKEFTKYIDVCIGNEEDFADVLGIKSKGKTDIKSGELDVEGFKEMFKDIKDTFGFKNIACSLRESISATQNNWSALLYNGDNFYQSKKYSLHITDRVGGGDSFSAGLIYGLSEFKDEPQKSIDFAVAASALKHTISGDYNLASLNEVLTLMQGDGSGRIQR